MRNYFSTAILTFGLRLCQIFLTGSSSLLGKFGFVSAQNSKFRYESNYASVLMKAYLELVKPRITLMVVITCFIGYWLAGGREVVRLFWILVGTALASSSSGCLNQFFERKEDALMERTSCRPIPSGIIRPLPAFIFGAVCGLSGVLILAWKVNGGASFIAGLTIAIYLFGYTPLKKLTPQSTWVGAISGATPPLIGWFGARGVLDHAAWALFAIQFLWQIPHFLAIFWIYREDYKRAGFKVMPVVDPTGNSTACQIALHSFALLPASLMPTLCGMAGVGYGCGALAMGTAFLGLGLKASWSMTLPDARRLFFASLIYLPLLFGILLVGSGS